MQIFARFAPLQFVIARNEAMRETKNRLTAHPNLNTQLQ